MTSIITLPDYTAVFDHTLGVNYYGRYTHQAQTSDQGTHVRRGKSGFAGDIALIAIPDDTDFNSDEIYEASEMGAIALHNTFSAGTFLLQVPLVDLMFDDQRAKYKALTQLPQLTSSATHINREWQYLNFTTALTQDQLDSFKNYINMYTEIGGRTTQIVDIELTRITVNVPLFPTFPIQPVDPNHAHIYLRLRGVSPTIRKSRDGISYLRLPVIEAYGPETGTVPPVLPTNLIRFGAPSNFREIRFGTNYVRWIA